MTSKINSENQTTQATNELSESVSKVRLLNVNLDNLTEIELLAALGQGGIVYTPNADHLSKLQKDEEFYRTYQQATYTVCDSKILMYAARWLGTPLRAKISGSDLLPAFCEYYRADSNVKMFLLGGAEGVARQAQERINAKVGRSLVVAAHSPSFGFEKDAAECQQIVALIERSGANVLAIGLGAPKQEKWIGKYRQQLPSIRTFLAVGAAIDFEAGNRPRSPQWMSQLGLEWLYRLALEPRRLWRRYLIDDIPVLWLLFQQKLGIYRNPWPAEKSD